MQIELMNLLVTVIGSFDSMISNFFPPTYTFIFSFLEAEGTPRPEESITLRRSSSSSEEKRKKAANMLREGFN